MSAQGEVPKILKSLGHDIGHNAGSSKVWHICVRAIAKFMAYKAENFGNRKAAVYFNDCK